MGKIQPRPDYLYGFIVYNVPTEPGKANIDRLFVGPMEYERAFQLWSQARRLNEYEVGDVIACVSSADFRVNWL